MRKDGETYVAYVKRVVGLVRDGQLSYLDMGNALLGADNCYSSDNLRKAFYVLNKIVDKLETEIVVTDNDLLIEIENQKDELYKASVRARDKKRELNKLLTEQARFENLVNVMTDALYCIEPFEIKKEVNYVPSETEASLLWSDWHYGITIDNQVNFYNTDIAKERVSQMVSKVIDYCKMHRVKTLHIESLGDAVNGVINVANRVEQEEDIITQIMEVSEVMAGAIAELSKHIPEIRVYCVYGNHSRCFGDKSQATRKENFERMIAHYLKVRLPDITIISSKVDDYLVMPIAGRTIVMCHGDKDSSSNAVKNYVNVINRKPDEIHMGHYHNFSISNDNDCEIIVNGSLVSTDDYAISLRRSTKASQTLRIYGEDCCTYNIILN